MRNRSLSICLVIILLSFFMLSGCDLLGFSGGDEEASATETEKRTPAKKKKKVLVLHSYHAEYVWMKDVNRGILSGFAEERFVPRKNMILEYSITGLPMPNGHKIRLYEDGKVEEIGIGMDMKTMEILDGKILKELKISQEQVQSYAERLVKDNFFDYRPFFSCILEFKSNCMCSVSEHDFRMGATLGYL